MMEVSMPAIPLRMDYDAATVRALARTSSDSNQVRRLLAGESGKISLVNQGGLDALAGECRSGHGAVDTAADDQDAIALFGKGAEQGLSGLHNGLTRLHTSPRYSRTS